MTYNLADDSVKRYTQDHFSVRSSPSDTKNNYDNHNLEIRGNQVFVVHNTIGDQFYVLDKGNGNGDQLFTPLDITPANTRAHSVWKDDQNNLLFVVEYLNTKNYKMGAYLLDNSNQLFDYSPMIEGMPLIKSVLSKDFRQQLYLGTSSGAYFIQSSSKNAITAYPEIKGGLRHIGQLANDQFLVRSQRNWLKILMNGQVTDLPQKSCLANKSDFEGPISLITSPNGEVWLKSKHALTRYEPAADGSCMVHTFDFVISNATFLTEHKIALVESKTNQLSVFDLQDGSRTTITAFTNQSAKGKLHYLLPSTDNILWLATIDGLFKVNWITNEVLHFGDTPDFEDKRIITLHDDHKGRLWMGTVDSGIQIFDKAEGKVVKIVDESAGLSNNIVVGILEDDQGYIWAATYNGLNLLKSTGEMVTIFKKEDGLTENEFNRYAHFKATDGRLLFGTVNGLNVIDPAKVKEVLQASRDTKIYVSSLSFFDPNQDKTIRQRNYEAGERRLKLRADKRFISLSIGASNYGQNTKNRYAYQLKGIDEDWTYIGNENSIRLSNLPAGKFDLEIVGVDHNGNKIANTILIPIHAQEYFYKQAWFYILLAIPFFVFGLLWVHRLRKGERYARKRSR